MKAKLVAFSLCALLALSIVTVQLKTREAMLRYEIADLDALEEVLYERLVFLKCHEEMKTGSAQLLDRAIGHDIRLYLGDSDGMMIPLLTPVEEDAYLE